MMIQNDSLIERRIRQSLEEDLGPGDITTDAVIDPRIKGKAFLIAREELMLAGLPIFKKVFRILTPAIEFIDYFDEGSLVPAGKKIGLMTGSLSSILKGERTALNFLQRMSGIATLTGKYVERAGSSKVKILDTRKTAPGLRVFDKYAVRIGGGVNHRFGLFDGILIKDNHIAVAGSIKNAIELVRKKAPHTLRIEVEVEDLAELKEALQAGVDAILLDNMDTDQMKKAVKLANGSILLEASGGISLDSVAEIAKTGVNLISVGALTHSLKASDLSLNIIPD